MGTFGHLSFVKHPTELFDTDFDRLNHELRTIVALQEAGMQFWVLLRQEEGLSDFPVVEIGEIDTAVVVIVTTAGNHDPMAIARPRGVAVGIVLTVEEGKIEGRSCFSGEARAGILFHRDTDDISIMVPAVETTVLSQGK